MVCNECGLIGEPEVVEMYGNGYVLQCSYCGADMAEEEEADEPVLWPVEVGGESGT